MTPYTVYIAPVVVYVILQCLYNAYHSTTWSKTMMDQDHPGYFIMWLISLALCIPLVIVAGICVLATHSTIQIAIK